MDPPTIPEPPAPVRAAAARDPELAPDELLHDHQQPDGVDGRQRPARSPQLRLEDATALTPFDVSAHGRRDLGDALRRLAQVDPDLIAGEQAGLRGLGQPHACADEEGLHARDRGLHGLRDVFVGERVDLAHEERGALAFR